jgi:hypothetical protein
MASFIADDWEPGDSSGVPFMMTNPKKPPLDFWLWLAVIGLTVIVAVSSLTFPERVAPDSFQPRTTTH